jgi:pimeloyl-ACP methyl ester carboxylesterase
MVIRRSVTMTRRLINHFSTLFLRQARILLHDGDVQPPRGIATVRLVCAGSILSVAVLAAAPSWSQTDAPPQLQARVLGDGAPVVLLGGGLLGADGWGQVPRVLARTRRVLNLQSLAVQYGLEDRSLPAGYSIQTEVDALGRTLNAMRADDVDIIGMSHGAVVAIVFALQNPQRVRTLTLIEPPAFWVLPNHGRDTDGAREMQALVTSLRGRTIEEEHVERFRCLLGDCIGGRSPRRLPQWPQWVKYRNSLRGLYTVGDYDDDPARLRRLRAPTLVVTGAQTVAFHRRINETLLQALPLAEPLELGAGHNSPSADPEHFVEEWQKFQKRSPY